MIRGVPRTGDIAFFELCTFTIALDFFEYREKGTEQTRQHLEASEL